MLQQYLRRERTRVRRYLSPRPRVPPPGDGRLPLQL